MDAVNITAISEVIDRIPSSAYSPDMLKLTQHGNGMFCLFGTGLLWDVAFEFILKRYVIISVNYLQ